MKPRIQYRWWAPKRLIILAILPLIGCGTSPQPFREVAKATVRNEADSSCAIGLDGGQHSSPVGDVAPDAPEIASAYLSKNALHASNYMAVTANPIATLTACEILRDGGSAMDAAIATQMVLNLVEPQSSGIGGGALILYYDAGEDAVLAYDGREVAPRRAGHDYLRYVSDGDPSAPVVPNARESGRSVGIPGVVRVLELAHKDHGRLPWKALFRPAIDLARDGFRISPRMARSVEHASERLYRDPDTRRYFLTSDGRGKPAGTLLRNPSFAETLQMIADGGADAFYAGPIALDIARKVRHPATLADNRHYSVVTPGLLDIEDLVSYRAIKRDPLCTDYRQWVICGFPPPSSGGIAVAQVLGILENFDLAALRPTEATQDGGVPNAQAVHLISEAERLAYADRDRYVADTDFVALPNGSISSLVSRQYLKTRARIIQPDRSMGFARPGLTGSSGGADARPGLPETTHFSIVDRYGNAVSMTTTIEGGFGSFAQVRGFLLNNQLTDFSPEPESQEGLMANRVEGGKRPRSSMAPTLVFDRDGKGSRGELVLVTGSPGGGAIIQFVVKSIVASLDWGLDAQQAASLPHFGAANNPVTVLEDGHPDMAGLSGNALQRDLQALGHQVRRQAAGSGLSVIARKVGADGHVDLTGGSDPRRESSAMGN